MIKRMTAAVSLVCSLVGCSSSRPDEELAREAVIEFFSALPTEDCRVIGPWITSRESCEEVVEEYNSHGMKLLEVHSAERDGRNPNAIVVRVRLEQDGKPQKQAALLRVEKRDGRWRYRP